MRRQAYIPLLSAILLFAVPAGAHLVVNEIDYDQSGTDTAEFIEIKNVRDHDENLADYKIDIVNGTGGGATIVQEIFLPAVTLSPGEYYVICADAANVANCDLDVDPDTNLIQNGAPDAVAIAFLDGSIYDTVSYEGDTGAPYTEGSGDGLEDDPALDGWGISRCEDGVDTEVNNVDLKAAPSTPGGENSCDEPPPFTLAISGTCPGDVTLDVTNGTPDATAAILLGSDVGSDALPGGPCVGEVSGLTLIGLGSVITLDANGAFSIQRNVPSCDLTLQVLDSATCGFTNTDNLTLP